MLNATNTCTVPNYYLWRHPDLVRFALKCYRKGGTFAEGAGQLIVARRTTGPGPLFGVSSRAINRRHLETLPCAAPAIRSERR